jgi:hypothetical protein
MASISVMTALALGALVIQPMAPSLATGALHGGKGDTPCRVRADQSVSLPPERVEMRATAAGPASTSAAQTVAVTIPPVVFASDVLAVGGRLSTPILLAQHGGAPACAYVSGRDGSRLCSSPLAEGIVTQLNCRVGSAARQGLRIVVVLSNGEVLSVPIRTDAGTQPPHRSSEHSKAGAGVSSG